jgi:hypothetical protein
VVRFPRFTVPSETAKISIHQVIAHTNHELVVIHHPSGTLINADMLFNLPANEQYSRAGGLPMLSKLVGGGRSMSPGGGVHGPAASGMARDKTYVYVNSTCRIDGVLMWYGGWLGC